MSLDAALDRLAAALRHEGVEAWRAPDELAALRALEADLAPLRLPSEVREFWTRVDAATLSVQPYPRLHGPDFAHECWRMARDEFSGLQPLALIQVGYDSHQCMSAELDTEDLAGGALWEWNLVDGGFERRFDGITQWLDAMVEQIRAGEVERYEAEDGPVLILPSCVRTDDAKTVIERDILGWPEHWQRVAGIRPEDLEPRGATHTIAELLSTHAELEVRATIVGTVVGLIGGSDWTQVRVRDASGAIDVFCPAEANLVGAGIRQHREFDVVVAPGPRLIPPDPEAAGQGIDDDSDRLVAIMVARHGAPAGAIAERVRRI